MDFADKGYTHEPIEEIKEDEVDEEASSIIDLAARVEPQREDAEQSRTERKLILLDYAGEMVEVVAEDIDSDFDIGFSEAGRSPVSQMEMRNNILQLSDKLLQLLQVAEQSQGSMSVLATEIYKTIHEQFEFPKNLSFDYIQGQLAQQAEAQPQEVPAGQAPPQEQQQAQPEEGQMSPDQVIEQLKAMPPAQALEAMKQIFADDPQAQELIDKALGLPEQQQAQAVQMLIEAIEVPQQ